MDEELRRKSCVITGHRRLPAGQLSRITDEAERQVERLLGQGVEHFFIGGALGFDMLAAYLLLNLREVHPQLQVTFVLACLEQDRLWSHRDRTRYQKLYKQANTLVLLQDRYTQGCMLARNRYMVDRAAICLAYWTHSVRSGTANTVAYARRNGLDIVNVAPSGALYP